jgi:hypothetical protein
MGRTIAHKPRITCRWALISLALPGLQLLPCAAVGAATPQPLASRNLSPLYASLGVPVLRSAEAPRRGEWQGTYSLHWASHSLQATGEGATLEFDGETQRHDLSLRAGLTDRLAVEASLPYVRHSEGHLDALIDDWHAFWGLPDGYRDDQPRDRLHFAYTGSPGFFLDDPTSGLGDAELGLSWRLLDRRGAAVAVFAQAKLASGDRERFTGSGDTGYSAGVRVTFPECLLPALSCHTQLGIADVGRIAWAPDADRHAAFASIALTWRLGESIALTGQLDAHGVVYDASPLDESGVPLWGSLGLRWSFADAWTLEAGFSEDLVVGAAPDITFMAALARRF